MPRTVNEQIVGKLRRKILMGGFDRVTFLPPERKLAAEFEVGRGMLRGALETLCREGIIYRVPKRGLRIKKTEPRRLKRVLLRLPGPMPAKVGEEIAIVAGICAGAGEIFAEVVLSAPPAPLNLTELRERYNAGDIQGIIVLEHSPGAEFSEIAASGIPFVIANQEDEGDFPCVRMDYRAVGRLAGQRLFQTRCRRPLIYTGDTEKFMYREILAGFRGAAAEEGVMLDESMIVRGDFNCEAPELTEKLSLPAGRRPDAVFTVRDYRAAHVFRLCEKFSLRIPDDLGLISYDDVSWPSAEEQGLTSVAEEVNQIGRQSVLLLRNMYESKEPHGGTVCLIPPRLVERRTLKPVPPDRRTVYTPA